MNNDNSSPVKKSVWQDALAWFRQLHPAIFTEMPKELPPEDSTDFWPSAARLEMALRKDVNLRAEGVIGGDFSTVDNPAIAWLLHRRLEWASQLIYEAALDDPFPDFSLEKVLRWSLIDSWDSDGCVGFWIHAVERGGALPPEDPHGFARRMKANAERASLSRKCP